MAVSRWTTIRWSAIRAISLGRKNALFAGSAVGSENWAILASLINSAKLHELDPQTYLADVLERESIR